MPPKFLTALTVLVCANILVLPKIVLSQNIDSREFADWTNNRFIKSTTLATDTLFITFAPDTLLINKRVFEFATMLVIYYRSKGIEYDESIISSRSTFMANWLIIGDFIINPKSIGTIDRHSQVNCLAIVPENHNDRVPFGLCINKNIIDKFTTAELLAISNKSNIKRYNDYHGIFSIIKKKNLPQNITLRQ